MEYSIKKIETDEKSLAEITRFLQETFPKNKKFTSDFVKWQYVENPLGHMLGFNAWKDNRIVSHFAGLPIEMELYGKKRKGLLCINVSTNVNHREKKLFATLGEKTAQYAKEIGLDFMIAVPNANSTHGFLKHFGFYLISPLSVKIGMGKMIYNSKKFDCYKSWDDEQWIWRLNNPTNTYSYKKEMIYTPISFFAKTVSKAQLSDKIVRLISSKTGFQPLNLYIGLGGDTSKGLYFNIPSFIKRPPFNLVFKDLTGNIPKIEKDNIFLQLIDLDTI